MSQFLGNLSILIQAPVFKTTSRTCTPALVTSAASRAQKLKSSVRTNSSSGPGCRSSKV